MRCPETSIRAAALVCAALASCGERAERPVCVGSQPPARLSETGLYADVAAGIVHADSLPFAPQYPLWSDGARKRRWIRLPAGSAIDASDPDAWEFPVGTRLWKEFAFERRIETRFMERGTDGEWTFAAYVWNAEGTDAELAPASGIVAACESSPGVAYDVPARADCVICHEGGRGPVLGFSALQLSADRDPLAPHAEEPPPGAVDLDALLARGLVEKLPRRFADVPPRIEAASPRERAVLGYLHANCGACHSASGSLAHLGLALAHDLEPADHASSALSSTLERPSAFAFSRDASSRIAAGDPDHSVLVGRMATREPSAQMPPIGTRAVDHEALQLVRAWVREDLAAGRSNRPRRLLVGFEGKAPDSKTPQAGP